jgi:hypothetical protein
MDPRRTNEETKTNTLAYSEQLTSMVKSNQHQLALEKQMMQAKKFFQKKSKGQLIDLILSMTNKIDKSKRKYYKNIQKSDLIVILVKNWMLNKSALDKKVNEEILAMPDEVKETVMDMAKTLAETETENKDETK